MPDPANPPLTFTGAQALFGTRWAIGTGTTVPLRPGVWLVRLSCDIELRCDDFPILRFDCDGKVIYRYRGESPTRRIQSVWNRYGIARTFRRGPYWYIRGRLDRVRGMCPGMTYTAGGTFVSVTPGTGGVPVFPDLATQPRPDTTYGTAHLRLRVVSAPVDAVAPDNPVYFQIDAQAERNGRLIAIGGVYQHTFRASNGWMLRSVDNPEINAFDRILYVRGSSVSRDHTVLRCARETFPAVVDAVREFGAVTAGGAPGAHRGAGATPGPRAVRATLIRAGDPDWGVPAEA